MQSQTLQATALVHVASPPGDFAERRDIDPDEPNIRSGLEKGLAKEATVIETARDADEALATFRSTPFQLVVADVRLPSVMNCLEMIEQILRSRHRRRPS